MAVADAGDLLSAATKALAAWDIPAGSLTLASQSENTVYRLDVVDGRSFAVRVHRPGYSSLADLESELMWSTALLDAGIDLPRALRTRDGDGYVGVALPSGLVTYVGVIEWVSGVAMADVIEDLPAAEAIARHRDLGVVAGRVRTASDVWTPPADFSRRAWDRDALMGDDPLWGRFWDIPQLTAAQRDLLLRTRNQIRTRLDEFGTTPDRYGLVHADLHARNVLVDGDKLRIIDFDDSGYSWHMYELAIIAHAIEHQPFSDDAVAALVEGYRSQHPLPDDHLDLLPMFVLIRWMILLGWINDRPEVGIDELLPDYITTATRQAEAFLTTP